MSASHLALPALLLLATISSTQAHGCQHATALRSTVHTAVFPGSPEHRRRARQTCSREFRTLDGSCTNGGRGPGNKLWASAGTAHFTYRKGSSSERVTRKHGASARLISNVISSQPGNTRSRRGITEFFVFFGEFLDHNLIGTAFDRKGKFDIPIPKGDRLFANFSGFLPFQRSERVRGLDGRAKRAMNTVSSALDLSAVYGSDEKRAASLRGPGCMLKTSAGDLMPLNTPRLENEPSHDASFFLAGDGRANDHPVLTALHTIFLREHNALCKQLTQTFPRLSSELVFQHARKINIAQFQKVVFEEFYPAITGRFLPPYRRYNPNVNPAVSDIFSTAGYRIGHTLVGNEVQLRGPRMSWRRPLPFEQMFFNPAAQFRQMGLEAFVRGSIDEPAQEVDEKVSDSLRDFLFSNVKGTFETKVDLIALNIQRGRDHALPSYNGVRIIVGLHPVSSFAGVTSNKALQARLQAVYRTPDDIDPWIGLMCEDHVRGSSMGQTVKQLWEIEFRRFRDGDRFHYARPGLFPKEFVGSVPKVARLLSEKGTMKRLLLEHSKITASEISGPIFRKGGIA